MPTKPKARKPACKPCSACGNKPTYERILGNRNRNWFLYNCPICEWDGPAQPTLREAAIHWNKRQRRARVN
jgi:hypothetical protein